MHLCSETYSMTKWFWQTHSIYRENNYILCFDPMIHRYEDSSWVPLFSISSIPWPSFMAQTEVGPSFLSCSASFNDNAFHQCQCHYKQIAVVAMFGPGNKLVTKIIKLLFPAHGKTSVFFVCPTTDLSNTTWVRITTIVYLRERTVCRFSCADRITVSRLQRPWYFHKTYLSSNT